MGLPGVAQIVADTWDDVVDGVITARQALRVVMAVLAGRVSGAGTSTEVFKGQDETTDRITSTVDSSGNRTEVSLDVS